jgi:hypothetical protein
MMVTWCYLAQCLRRGALQLRFRAHLYSGAVRARESDYFAALGANLAAGVLNCTVSATSLPSVGSLA